MLATNILGPALDIRGVCAELECHPSTVYRWIASGRLKAHKLPGRNGKIWVTEEALRACRESLFQPTSPAEPGGDD